MNSYKLLKIYYKKHPNLVEMCLLKRLPLIINKLTFKFLYLIETKI
jgi:hypothetical protein